MRDFVYLLVLFFLISSCGEQSVAEDTSIFELLDTKTTQVNFKNQLTSSAELNILTYLYFYNGAGVGVADFDNDGQLDLFFTGNQTQNELYLNLGDFKFKNITKEANIPNNNWSTGVTSVDINQDGWMDIYISQVTGLAGETAQNQLLINQGKNEEGIPVFKEMAEAYGLAISSYAQQVGFVDYDKDGDLDLFLLNHSLYPNRTYGHGDKRNTSHPKAGDKIFKNQNGTFVEVTKETGIFSSEIGYGLGFSFSDINRDGYVDLYVGNDFFENDYLYINQKNNSFKEIIHNDADVLGHTTHFSMGNAIADINNDLLPDILSVDMLPESITEYKVSGAEYPFLTYQNYLKNNYSPQFMSNTLHINQGNLSFSEVANQKQIAASDWSWSALIADLNNDSFSDIFIANGILGATNNLDFIKFISNTTYQDKINRGLEEKDLMLLDELPKFKKKNKLFINDSTFSFTEVFKNWEDQPVSYSNGATYADLNNDGKLDLIVNNINDKAFIYKNNSKGNFLLLNFEGEKPNRNGIGAKVILFKNHRSLMRENFLNQGYMSSTAPGVHFGLGEDKKVDSLKVIWPDDSYQVLYDIDTNQQITLKQSDASATFDYAELNSQSFVESLPSESIPFKHHEYQSYEFNRQPLLPFMNANLGPKISIEDVNQDGLDDIFIGNAKLKASRLFIQQSDNTFEAQQRERFAAHEQSEDVDQAFVDVDLDGDKDLIVVSAGNEFSKGKPLQPRLYLSENGTFKFYEKAFPEVNEQFNSIAITDINQDGFPDVFFGAGVEYATFGASPKSYLMLNTGDHKFSDATLSYFASHKMGMIRGAHFKNLDEDSQPELILAGYFMPIEVYKLKEKKFHKLDIDAFKNTDGLWNTIHFTDLNSDGFDDLFVGNFGTNTKLKASPEHPMTLYLNDFNQNQNIESVLTYHHDGKQVLFNTKDELASQIPSINKRFRSYQAFAEASIQEVLGPQLIEEAETEQVFTLQSMFFKNNGNLEFEALSLPQEVQYSAINTALSIDINLDGNEELILAGNRFNLNTQLGQLDANHGLILNYQNDTFSVIKDHNFNLNGRINSAEILKLRDEKWFIFGTNNDSLQFFRRLIK